MELEDGVVVVEVLEASTVGAAARFCQENNSGILSLDFFPSTKCSLHTLLWKLTCDAHRPIKANHTYRIFFEVGNV